MANQQEYQLIDYLDRVLTEQEMREVETLIQTDYETQQQWQHLQMAVQAVEYAALYEQVAEVKEQYKAFVITPDTPAAKSKVRTMSRVFQMAATFVLLVTAIALYKYITTSNTTIYKEVYLPYQLNTSRSGGTMNELELAYKSANWQDVLTTYNKLAEKDNKARFLAGMANMELKQFAPAARLFEQVLAENARTGDDYFGQEAEFYLSMSYLALDRVKEALPVLDKIKASTTHPFHEQAGRITTFDLKIAAFKSAK